MHNVNNHSDPRIALNTKRCVVAYYLSVYIVLIQTHSRFHDCNFPVYDIFRLNLYLPIFHDLSNIFYDLNPRKRQAIPLRSHDSV